MYSIFETELYARDRQKRLMEAAEKARLINQLRQQQSNNGRSNGLKRAGKFLAKFIPSASRTDNASPSLEEHAQATC